MGVDGQATKLSVTIQKVEKVLPAQPKEDHAYWLTNLDQNVATIVKTVSVYPAKEGVNADPVNVIKDGLVKLLDFFYPLAGRLGISAEGKLQVNYNSQGVVFAVASTDATLAELDDISKPDQRLQELVYTDPEATNILETPLVTAQVTKFKCGGFVFGLANQHAIFDGIGAVEFMKAWGEMARGLPLSTVPCLDRSMLKARSPPQVDFSHDEFSEIVDVSKSGQLTINEVVHNSFCFTPADIDVLKKRVIEEGGLKRCTTFEVLTALIWRTRSKALQMEPEQKTRLYFAVDGRAKFSPPLPAGFMGNGIVLTYAMTTAEDLCEKPLYHAVKLVKDAIALIDDRYMRSAIDYYEMTRARPALTGSIIVTTWSKLPFESLDFGWGEPSQSGPVTVPDPGVVLCVAHGNERKSVNVLLGLPPRAMERFEKQLLVKDM